MALETAVIVTLETRLPIVILAPIISSLKVVVIVTLSFCLTILSISLFVRLTVGAVLSIVKVMLSVPA